MPDRDVAETLESRPWRSWRASALEVVVSVATVAMFLASCLLIRVYPIDRLGQVSGLASLALRFFLFGIVLVIALIVAARVRGGSRFELTKRLVCAATAGLVSALVAGGVMIALRGTPWGLNAMGGDVGILAERAAALARGEPLPPLYPPLSLHVLRIYADVMHMSPGHAIKDLQILGIAAFGPLAYLSWRLLLRPVWALGIGVTAMIPLIEPYKPFPNLVLVAFVPLAILFLDKLRHVAKHHAFLVARTGVAFGLAFGILCLTYSGWFQWAAPGLLVATLIVFPWRTAWKKGLVHLAVTGAAFLMVAGRYLAGLLGPAAKIVDDYIYFDVKAEPMYVAMWRGDAPGDVGTWPPLGELGGVGLFTILLAIGFGVAVAMGRKTTVVITLGATMAGAWLLRFLFARLMWETKLVQLYPRTTPLIVYCLLTLSGYAVYWLVQRMKADHPLRGPSGVIGAVCALLLVFGSAGSATADRYMPSQTDPPGVGFFAYNAHVTNWNTKRKPQRSRAMQWQRRSVVPEPTPGGGPPP